MEQEVMASSGNTGCLNDQKTPLDHSLGLNLLAEPPATKEQKLEREALCESDCTPSLDDEISSQRDVSSWIALSPQGTAHFTQGDTDSAIGGLSDMYALCSVHFHSNSRLIFRQELHCFSKFKHV
jgi:hypothetical protein